jgi:hypothetical protein
MARSTPLESAPAPTASKTPAKLTVPTVANIRKTAMAKPASPTRFMRNAFLPAVAALGRRNQKEISRYDARPTPSQPR